MDWYRLLPPYWQQNYATCKRLKKAIHEAWLDAMIAEREKRDA